MIWQRIERTAEVKRGDKLLLRFDVDFAGQTAARKIAEFIARYNAERPLTISRFELTGNPVYDPVNGTLNLFVTVRGTPLVAIISALLPLFIVVGVSVIFRDAFLQVITQDVGPAIRDLTQPVGTGLGVGLALAGIVAGAWLLGAIELR